ncbi:unnamed protein product [Eruca vesicaria subsp. sativa]|uniref:Uncharacterized protein n=1 Tax=Eruca vesicaria subsp. sativa TaxID=29727 RepID=A0ABC8IYK0_ERUVS|nr:unnamed protein product [Eruca vesicaria subsp. sativa]
MSLSLRSYTFRNSHPFRNCSNLRTLKLYLINATKVEVFNTLLSSCPSLEVLVLYIACTYYNIGLPLKIENNKLKILQVLLINIGGLKVSSTSLNILFIDSISFKDRFFLCAPDSNLDNNNASNESWEKKFWEEVNNNNVAFPNAKFRVKNLRMPNFSGLEEEFAFASCLIKHGTVIDKMMIKTSNLFKNERHCLSSS